MTMTIKHDYIFSEYREDFFDSDSCAKVGNVFFGDDVGRIIRVHAPERNTSPVSDTIPLCGHHCEWRQPIKYDTSLR